MTDRQVGGLGASIDLTAIPDRRVGSLGAQVDLVPPQTFERQVGSLGVMVETSPPVGNVVGALGVLAELVETPARRLSSLLLMVEYVAGSGPIIPTTAARWAGSVFEMGTSSPLVYWSSGMFQLSGTSPVVWQTDHFEEAP